MTHKNGKHVHWLCPYCTDVWSNDYVDDDVTLRYEGNDWYTCPTCGHSTCAPNDDGCWPESGEQAAMWYLMEYANISEDAAAYLIEWIADSPMTWARKYAPYVWQTDEEIDPDTWERENPGDTVIYDAMFDGALIISECPIWMDTPSL